MYDRMNKLVYLLLAYVGVVTVLQKQGEQQN